MMNNDDMTGQRNALEMSACTCANLRKAARVVTQAYDAALQPIGLKATQLTVLATLANRGGMPLTRLAEALVMDRTTLTRNLKPLERQRQIRIEQEADQRVRKVALTEAGARILKEAQPFWAQAQSQIHRKLGQHKWSNLLNNLSATIAAVRDP